MTLYVKWKAVTSPWPHFHPFSWLEWNGLAHDELITSLSVMCICTYPRVDQIPLRRMSAPLFLFLLSHVSGVCKAEWRLERSGYQLVNGQCPRYSLFSCNVVNEELVRRSFQRAFCDNYWPIAWFGREFKLLPASLEFFLLSELITVSNRAQREVLWDLLRQNVQNDRQR